MEFTIADLKLAICKPPDDPTYIDNSIQELNNELWYIKEKNGQYYFDTEVNDNRIIED